MGVAASPSACGCEFACKWLPVCVRVAVNSCACGCEFGCVWLRVCVRVAECACSWSVDRCRSHKERGENFIA